MVRFYCGAAIEERRNRKGYCGTPLSGRSSIVAPAAVAVRGAAIKALLYGPNESLVFYSCRIFSNFFLQFSHCEVAELHLIISDKSFIYAIVP